MCFGADTSQIDRSGSTEDKSPTGSAMPVYSNFILLYLGRSVYAICFVPSTPSRPASALGSALLSTSSGLHHNSLIQTRCFRCQPSELQVPTSATEPLLQSTDIGCVAFALLCPRDKILIHIYSAHLCAAGPHLQQPTQLIYLRCLCVCSRLRCTNEVWKVIGTLH